MPPLSIHDACKNNDVSEVKRLLDQDDSLKDLGDGDGVTPLMVCSMNGSLRCLKLLAERGADANRKSKIKFTAAHYAVMQGKLECLKHLAEHCGADVRVKGFQGTTPLTYARARGRQSCVKYLEEFIRQGHPTGLDAIHDACKKNDVSEVKRLLDQDDSLSDLCDEYGITPFMRMAGYGSPEGIKLLLERGADVNRKCDFGNTAAHYAIMKDKLECLQYLVEHCGADVTVKDGKSRTPLDWAREKGHQSCVKYLEAELMHQGHPIPHMPSQLQVQSNPAAMAATSSQLQVQSNPAAMAATSSQLQVQSNPAAMAATSSQLQAQPWPIGAGPGNNFGSKALENWTVDDVCSFLAQECGAPQDVVNIFRDDEVDGGCLLILVKDDDNLKDMGVTKPAVRAKIISRVAMVQASKTAAAASSVVSQTHTHDDIVDLFPKI